MRQDPAMDRNAVKLDRTILEAFDEALSKHAPAVRDRLVEGTSEDEISGRFAAAGVRPSEDAVTWWSYFDLEERGRLPEHLDVLPDLRSRTVDNSVRMYRVARSAAAENARLIHPPPDPDGAWGAGWVPTLSIGSGGDVALDCAGPSATPSPVRAVYPDTVFGPDHGLVVAPSLGDLLVAATRWMAHTGMSLCP